MWSSAAAEVKSSLPSHKSHNPLKRESPFQLHYFPEIPLNHGQGRVRQRQETTCFQPDCYASGDSGETATGSEDQPAANDSADGLDGEQQGYNRGFIKGEKAGLAAAGIKLGDDDFAGLLTETIQHATRIIARASTAQQLDELEVPRLELPTIADGVDLGSLYELSESLAQQGVR